MTALEVRNLTKIYRLYDKPSSRLKEIILRRPFHREFTALNNITFTVKNGETLGIIGENGAGKSTLLKILSKTLSPTSGEFKINGRVSSLLELGSGFHPEFTGMENIFFYGSLLGIDRATMQKKVADIVEFAELGDFINYPIKTYSSGMFVRLAFSVAMAVDPEILIIDEVLAVGDLHFQKKSADKILYLKDNGKTIVFCSHELYHIARLCDRALWFKEGKINMEGYPLEVIQEYQNYQLSKNTDTDSVKTFSQRTTETPIFYIRKVVTRPSQTVHMGDDLYVEVQIAANNDKIPYRVAVTLRTVDGLFIIGIGTLNMEPFYGSRTVVLLFPEIPLRSVNLIIEAFIFDAEGVYWYDRKEAPPIKIPRESIELGIINLKHEWILEGV